jgi:hypothetical protein
MTEFGADPTYLVSEWDYYASDRDRDLASRYHYIDHPAVYDAGEDEDNEYVDEDTITFRKLFAMNEFLCTDHMIVSGRSAEIAVKRLGQDSLSSHIYGIVVDYRNEAITWIVDQLNLDTIYTFVSPRGEQDYDIYDFGVEDALKDKGIREILTADEAIQYVKAVLPSLLYQLYRHPQLVGSSKP